MKRKNQTPLIIIVGFILVGGFVYATNTPFPNAEDPFFEGNVRSFSLTPLSLVQDTGSIDCDSWLQISATYDDNTRSVLASGSEGMAPFLDNSNIPLDLVKSGKGVKNVHFEYALECSGDAMDYPGASTVVSGTVYTRISGDPDYDSTTYLFGKSGSASASNFDPYTFSSTSLQDGVFKVMYSHNYQESQLLSFFDTGNGKIHFKHEAYPVLNFVFCCHPEAGQFTASYDAVAENDIVIAQYGLIENTAFALPVDTDGDGIDDGDDLCPTQPETVNGFEDNDGCPDTVPGEEDSDEDGIPDNVDECDNQPETYNGFEDEDGCPDINPSNKQLRITQWFPKILDIANNEDSITIEVGVQNFELNEVTPEIRVTKEGDSFVKDTFSLPNECTQVSLGWKDCIFAIGLDLDKYPIGGYEIILYHQVRDDITVGFNVIDTTPTEVCGETISCPDPDPDPDPVEEVVDVITEFFGDESTTTTTGVKITRSNSTFGEFGQDDMVILLVLMAIVIGVALMARLKKKGR